MRLSSHLCLLSDGSLARNPLVELDAGGRIVGLSVGVGEERHSTLFFSGVLVCGLPDVLCEIETFSRADFCRRLSPYSLAVGATGVCVLGGVDLNTFCGTWRKIKI